MRRFLRVCAQHAVTHASAALTAPEVALQPVFVVAMAWRLSCGSGSHNRNTVVGSCMCFILDMCCFANAATMLQWLSALSCMQMIVVVLAAHVLSPPHALCTAAPYLGSSAIRCLAVSVYASGYFGRLQHRQLDNVYTAF